MPFVVITTVVTKVVSSDRQNRKMLIVGYMWQGSCPEIEFYQQQVQFNPIQLKLLNRAAKKLKGLNF